MTSQTLRIWFAAVLLILCGASAASGQAELLPIDHPATQTLIRLYEFGIIPEFPREHLPLSRGAALRLLRKAAGDSSLPAAMRQQATYYSLELSTDDGTVTTQVFIPTSDESVPVYRAPLSDQPLAIIWFRDTASGIRLAFEPDLSAEVRIDPSDFRRVLIAQGGANLRGTILNHLGFDARITNGTITGDSLIALRDPAIAHEGKYGVEGYGRDILFAGAHIRGEFEPMFAEIGRERVQMGGGLDQSLLLGSALPSLYDYLRFGLRLGRVQFTHIHASVLSDPVGSARASIVADIPPKYVAAHLLSIGPFSGVRASIGESVVYTGRPMEIGYINPLNFIKSQEQYLRDRDNAFMYAALSVNPFAGLFLEGEFMLDDLKFSRIGKGYWGNKTASRLGVRATGLLGGRLDAAFWYTRVEPFTFSHFDSLNSYAHDGTGLSAGGLEPNSYQLSLKIVATPAPNFWITGTFSFAEHGENIVDSAGRLVRNVGGDMRRTNDTTSVANITLLDGTLEKTLRMQISVEYELLRNVYLHLQAINNVTDGKGIRTMDTQIRLGAKVGVF